MNIVITDDYSGMSLTAARAAAEYINKNPGALLCFAAGATPTGMFEELIKMQELNKVDLASVFYAGLDEWVGLGYGDRGSCRQVMFDAYYTPAGIPEDRIHVFDGLDSDTQRQCRLMEKWVESRGGIGLTVLGIGMNGHIGFNEPNTPDREGCFTVPLDDTTKSVSVKYFGRQLPVEHGITIGWRMLKGAKNIILVSDGEKKAPIVKASLNGPMDSAVPASLMQDHPALTVIVDRGAALLLEPIGKEESRR